MNVQGEMKVKQFSPKWLLIGLVSIATVIMLILFWNGFFTTEEKAIQNAKSAAQNAFQTDEIPITKELEEISLYLPESMDIVSNSENNLILKEDEQNFILFYNPFEALDSDTFYKVAKEAKDIAFIESFSIQERFGYIRVIPLDDENYELQIGVGGVKMTTDTTKRSMKHDATMMMKVVRSIAYSTSDEG